MYSLNLLIVELETARTTLLKVFEVSNGTPNRTWHAAISGWAVRQNWPLTMYSIRSTSMKRQALIETAAPEQRDFTGVMVLQKTRSPVLVPQTFRLPQRLIDDLVSSGTPGVVVAGSRREYLAADKRKIYITAKLSSVTDALSSWTHGAQANKMYYFFDDPYSERLSSPVQRDVTPWRPFVGAGVSFINVNNEDYYSDHPKRLLSFDALFRSQAQFSP